MKKRVVQALGCLLAMTMVASMAMGCGNGSDTAFSYDDRTSLCNCKC